MKINGTEIIPPFRESDHVYQRYSGLIDIEDSNGSKCVTCINGLQDRILSRGLNSEIEFLDEEETREKVDSILRVLVHMCDIDSPDAESLIDTAVNDIMLLTE